MLPETQTEIKVSIDDDTGADLYLRAMLEQAEIEPGSVNWNGVDAVLDELWQDCQDVDEAQGEYLDWRN
jgi:hypothetical protein